jgi:CRISPR-associated endoribonuclease Cas6
MTLDSTTFHSIVLKLAPEREGQVRATHGHQAHAAFLHTVRQADPALAEVLHHSKLPIRLFTVSPLMGVGVKREGTLEVSPERDYFMRFTLLDRLIFEQFMARFLQGDGRPRLRLGQMSFCIKEILASPGSHPWAGYTSLVELAQNARPVERVTLQFATPTVFSFGKRQWGQQMVPLPIPRLVFGSLAKAWNALALPALNLDRKALRTYLEDGVVVAGLRGIRTRMLAYKDAPQVGFVGRVTFEFKGQDETQRACLDALAELAFYTGVGYKTPMGMGQCRRVVVNAEPQAKDE